MDYTFACPRYERAIDILGKRWTCLILRRLLAGPRRFSALSAEIPDLSDRMLSARLRELEADGIVERHVSPGTPLKVEYALTGKGHALAPVVQAIQSWADRWERDAVAHHHAVAVRRQVVR